MAAQAAAHRLSAEETAKAEAAANQLRFLEDYMNDQMKDLQERLKASEETAQKYKLELAAALRRASRTTAIASKSWRSSSWQSRSGTGRWLSRRA